MKAFLSHSSKDKPIAREVADEIRLRGGEVWLDERELSGGTPLATALSAAIDQIDVFIVFITANSNQSPWVKYEIDQALPLVLERSIRVLPLRYGDVPVPQALRGYLYTDGSNRDQLNHALNLTFASADSRLPLKYSEIKKRYMEHLQPAFCARVIRTKDLINGRSLGPTERTYVSVADYFEQSGRSLREILENLFIGKYLDGLLCPDDEFSIVVFEAGRLYEKKLDLLPGTWKAIYRILTDRQRLGIADPRPELRAEMGFPPRDYWTGNHDEWHERVRIEVQENGHPTFDDYKRFLELTFGIIHYDFTGDGRGPNGSRILFVKNLKLDELRCWRVDLGRVNAGNMLH